jgi:hypothetical protein
VRFPGKWVHPLARESPLLLGVLKQGIEGAPLTRLAEHDDGGAAKAEARFFLASLEGGVGWMNLDDAPDQGSHS